MMEKSNVTCQLRGLPLTPQYHMGGFFRGHKLNTFVPQGTHVEPLEQAFSLTQHNG